MKCSLFTICFGIKSHPNSLDVHPWNIIYEFSMDDGWKYELSWNKVHHEIMIAGKDIPRLWTYMDIMAFNNEPNIPLPAPWTKRERRKKKKRKGKGCGVGSNGQPLKKIMGSLIFWGKSFDTWEKIQGKVDLPTWTWQLGTRDFVIWQSGLGTMDLTIGRYGLCD